MGEGQGNSPGVSRSPGSVGGERLTTHGQAQQKTLSKWGFIYAASQMFVYQKLLHTNKRHDWQAER